MYNLNAILIKIPVLFFGGGAEIDKLILKCISKCKGTWIAKTILKMNSKMGGLTLPDFKTFYKATESRQYSTGMKIEI